MDVRPVSGEGKRKVVNRHVAGSGIHGERVLHAGSSWCPPPTAERGAGGGAVSVFRATSMNTKSKPRKSKPKRKTFFFFFFHRFLQNHPYACCFQGVDYRSLGPSADCTCFHLPRVRKSLIFIAFPPRASHSLPTLLDKLARETTSRPPGSSAALPAPPASLLGSCKCLSLGATTETSSDFVPATTDRFLAPSERVRSREFFPEVFQLL